MKSLESDVVAMQEQPINRQQANRSSGMHKRCNHKFLSRPWFHHKHRIQPNSLSKPLSVFILLWRRGYQDATFLMMKDMVIRLTGSFVGIDEGKNVVAVDGYPLCTQSTHGIANSEDHAIYVLKHDWPGENDAKDEDGMQHACFP